MRHAFVVGLLMVALSLNIYGCGRTPTAPAPSAGPATPSPPPSPTLTGITITGAMALTAIGQTSQLTATATYSDTTTKDVTTTTNWVSQSPSVVTISSSGLVTVVGFGVSNIQAAFQARQAFLLITATPPNTSVFYGRVREPGGGGILAARVLETQSGQFTLTDLNGHYSFGGLTRALLAFEKDGYEAAGQLDAPPNQFNDTALQRIVRVIAGGSLTALTLAPHDVSYTVGTDQCFPCKLIRVTMPTAGSLRVNLTWTEPRANTLNLWVNGGRFVGTGVSSNITRDVPVLAGEVLVYVGFYNPSPTVVGSTFYVPFSLATSVTP
jgi:hypothetical protein